MRTETRFIDGEYVLVACEVCPVCGEYQERIVDAGIYVVGYDCGH